VSGEPETTDAGRAILAAADVVLGEAAARDDRYRGARIVAIGWATVDLERAERELGQALGVRLDSSLVARDSELGATVRVARPFSEGPDLELLEPDTEGRLAALLARHGEGVVSVTVEVRGGQESGTRERLTLTSGRGVRAPRAAGDRPPWAAG
jgi:Glyoxalase/Bleomycin resistance protein/Dioxygenase superfamily